MHDRLVGFIFEIRIPSAPKMRSRPAIHFFQLFFSRTDLDASFDAISGKWASTLEVPLIEDSFLDLGNTSNEVVKTLGIYTRQSWSSKLGACWRMYQALRDM